MKFQQEILSALRAVIRPPSTSVLGIDIQNSRMRAAALSFRRNTLQWIQTFSIDLSPPNVKPLYTISKRLGDHWLQNAIVTTTLVARDTLIRPLEIKLAGKKDVSSVFTFQAEPLLPYPIEEAIVEKVTVRKEEAVTHLTVVAARKDHIQAHLSRMHAHSIEPEVISAEPVALVNFAGFISSKEESLLVINVGENTTSCVLTLFGKLYLARSVAVGFRDFKEALAKDHKLSFDEAASALEETIDFEALSPEKTPALNQASSRFRQEVVRAVYSLNTAATKTRLKATAQGLIMTGDAIVLKGIPKLLTDALQTPLAPIKPPPSITLSDQELLTFAIPIGLALSCSSEKSEVVDFRKETLAYPHPWKRLKKPLAVYGGLCLLITLMILFIGNVFIDRKERKLQQKFGELLANEEYSLSRFEEKFQGKISADGKTTIELQYLSAAQILERALLLDKTLKATPELFPLRPDLPKISDLLAWLATHPQVNPGEGEEQTIQIERVSYSLTKRPERNRPREKYQAQVELEFTAPTATMARAFHDALIDPNPFVDPKSEVKWSSTRGKWRASFILRDRTYYPTIGGKGL